MSSRYGSQALALGARLGGGHGDGVGSVDTAPEMAGFVVASPGRPRPADHDTGRSQIRADGLAPDPGLALNAPKRPAQTPQREDLLLCARIQDVPH
jgi:hypothetical protein